LGCWRKTQTGNRCPRVSSKYGEKLEADGKLECRYHVIGSHGGAWIYDVASNEELDRLLAMSPVYNFATYQVLALADMTDPFTVAGKSK
jgi:muconolactone delta-isomerase